VLPTDDAADPADRRVDDTDGRAIAEPPDQTLQRRGHQLAVLVEELAGRRIGQCRAIERAAVPLDGTHHEVDTRIPRDFTDARGFGAWQIDGALEIPTELLAALGRAAAQPRPEVETLRITADEGFGKHDQICSLGGGVAGKNRQFFDRSGRIEENGGGLNDS